MLLSPIMCAKYREIAEHRQYRLSGYSQPVACVASDERITEIERSVGRKLTGIDAICFDKDLQPEIVNSIVSQLIVEMA